MLSVTVHTTGVNWDGVIANTGIIAGVVIAFGTMLGRSIKRSLSDNTREIVHEVIRTDILPRFDEIDRALREHDKTLNQHSSEISYLQGLQKGREQAVADASLTTKPVSTPIKKRA